MCRHHDQIHGFSCRVVDDRRGGRAGLDRGAGLYLESEIKAEHPFEEIIGNSSALRRALQKVEVVASTDSTVLLLGETGTGKELLARAIHDRSSRRERTLVKINCAAIPSGLLESELFGHEKGAFTGAIAQKIGRFEVASGGRERIRGHVRAKRSKTHDTIDA